METLFKFVFVFVGVVAFGMIFQLFLFVVKRGLHVKRRVQVMREHPNAEFKSVVVQLRSATLFHKEQEIDEKIGAGGFGQVYRGRWHGTTVAIKRI